MKISELIARLQLEQTRFGDLECFSLAVDDVSKGSLCENNGFIEIPNSDFFSINVKVGVLQVEPAGQNHVVCINQISAACSSPSRLECDTNVEYDGRAVEWRDVEKGDWKYDKADLDTV